MIKIIKELNVEVTKPNIFQAIVAKQYDMNTRFLKVTLVDCGTIINVPHTETTKVIINAERKDGQSKGFDGEINNDGTVTVPLHSWMLELEGTVICDISVIDSAMDDNKKLTTTSFTLIVEKAAYGGDDVTSDPQFDVLVQLVETCSNATTAAEAALQKSAEALKRAESAKGVYVGSGEMPEGYNIQIDPDGDTKEYATKDYVDNAIKNSGGSSINSNFLSGKKIVYDGDSICESRSNNGGGYAKLIADMVGGSCFNNAVSGKRLAYVANKRNVVSELSTLPTDGDIYCFEGGYNDYWTPAEIGECSLTDYTGEVDTSTICGALETIFRYALDNFVGRPICFVITHKCGNTGYTANSLGHTFDDYRKAMIKVCEKYSIPYYDAFANSGLNGWNTQQSNLYLTANVDGVGDGIHPNEAGYKRYYVPQLIELFKSLVPSEITQDEPINEVINQVPISIDTDGSVFNEKGWIEGKRISSTGTVKDATGYNMTGFIKIKPTDKLYIGSGIWNHQEGVSTYNCVAGYKSDFTYINVFYDNTVGFTKNADGSYVYNLSQQSTLADVEYVRVVGDGINENAVITVNQPIV